MRVPFDLYSGDPMASPVRHQKARAKEAGNATARCRCNFQRGVRRALDIALRP